MDVEIAFYCSVSLNILRYFNERRESDRTARETVESKKTAKTLFIFARKKEKQTEELEFLSVSRKITFRRLVSSSCFVSHLWRGVRHWNLSLVKMQSNSEKNKGKQDDTRVMSVSSSRSLNTNCFTFESVSNMAKLSIGLNVSQIFSFTSEFADILLTGKLP